jgi:hypothetical protein
MSKPTGLTSSQQRLMRIFYALPYEKVVLNKEERMSIWDDYKTLREHPGGDLEDKCPALNLEILKSLATGNNVQSAVFSECSYAQTLANMLGLTEFYSIDRLEAGEFLQGKLIEHGISPRYFYTNTEHSIALLQAGGYGGVDAALVFLGRQDFFTIEFKEPGAKTSEVDLPKYGEDGFLKTTHTFNERYPQFSSMMDEQISKELNFFIKAGSNINDFSLEAISQAVSSNYQGTKYADAICVEDSDGMLTMFPANHAETWAESTRGEIRPAGRNHYDVWTEKALFKAIEACAGNVSKSSVSIPVQNLQTASARGGDGSVNRYKISPLFFVYKEDVTVSKGNAVFSIESVRQLNPTISAHMFFRKLQVSKVHDAYRSEL